MEEATAYRRLMEEFQLSQRQLAARLGKSPAGINETLRILSLPDEILESVRTSERLTRSVLLEIAKQETPEAQMALWHQAVSGTLTVKAARERKTASTDDAQTPKTRVPFKTKKATVTLVFDQEHVTNEDIVEALSQALREAKLALKASAQGTLLDTTP